MRIEAFSRMRRCAKIWLAFAVIGLLLVLGELAFRRNARQGWKAYVPFGDPAYRRIEALATGPDGTLWAVTKGGVIFFDRETWILHTPRQGLPQGETTGLAITSNGVAWLRTDRGLFSCESEAWHAYGMLALLLRGGGPVAAAPDGALWFGTGEEVLRSRTHLDTADAFPYWTTYNKHSGLPGGPVQALAVEPHGEVWVGTTDGLACYDGKSWTRYTWRDGLPRRGIRALTVAPDDTVWASAGRNLARFDGQSWIALPYAAPGGTAIALSFDRQGRLWIGTADNLSVWDMPGDALLRALWFWNMARAILVTILLTPAAVVIFGSRWNMRLVEWVEARVQGAAQLGAARLGHLGERVHAAWIGTKDAIGQAVARQRWFWVAFALVFLFGLFLRLWRLDYGKMLPYLAHADEQTQYNPALNIIRTGDLNPHFFRYPSLAIYIDTVVLYIGYWTGRLFGAFRSVSDLQPIQTAGYARGLVGTPAMLLLGRATTALFGTLTIGLVAALARQFLRKCWPALGVALLLAISPEHIRLSHYMTVDVIATFFAIACLACCTLYLVRQRKGWLWAAAICGGLATSSKYNYGLLALPVALSVFLDRRLWLEEAIKRLVLCGVLFGLAFVCTSPYVLLDFEAASRDIRSEMQHYAAGHLGQTGNSFIWYLHYMWRENFFYLLLGVPGMIIAFWRYKRIAVPMVVFAVVYWGLIGSQTVHMDRNALPVMALLMVGTGAAVDAFLSWLPSRLVEWRIKVNKVALLPVVAVAICLPLLPPLQVLPDILQPPLPSGQAQAQAWFNRALETLPGQPNPGQELKIAAEGYTIYLDPQRYNITYLDTVSKIGPPETFVRQGYDIVLLGSGMYGRFYGDRRAFAPQVRIYEAFFAHKSEMIAFTQRHDPLGFVSDGARVYVFFLTERAKRFRAYAEGVQE